VCADSDGHLSDEERLCLKANTILSQSRIVCPSCRNWIDRCGAGLRCPWCGERIEVRLAVDDRIEAWPGREAGIAGVRLLAMVGACLNMIGVAVLATGAPWIPVLTVVVWTGIVAVLALSTVVLTMVAMRHRLFGVGGDRRWRWVRIGIVGWLVVEAAAIALWLSVV